MADACLQVLHSGYFAVHSHWCNHRLYLTVTLVTVQIWHWRCWLTVWNVLIGSVLLVLVISHLEVWDFKTLNKYVSQYSFIAAYLRKLLCFEKYVTCMPNWRKYIVAFWTAGAAFTLGILGIPSVKAVISNSG
jgi:hypothetical protein